jgi:Flp pilus assembly protein TadB
MNSIASQTGILALCMSFTLAVLGTLALSRSQRRSALDVAGDLSAQMESVATTKNSVSKPRQFKKNEAGKGAEQAYALIASAAVVGAYSLIGNPSFPALLVAGGLTIVVISSYLKRKNQGAQAQRIREIEFFLPIIMERIVMAVQSGFDVLGSIKIVIEYDSQRRAHAFHASQKKVDPVTELMREVCQLAEAGRGLEDSLNEVAGKIQCPALRHAFIHLALAHKEGGELVMPLRELSDSTQAYYQESVEEEIAKMPVKATFPLLLTFAGLIIFFLIPPLIQVVDMTSKAVPK